MNSFLDNFIKFCQDRSVVYSHLIRPTLTYTSPIFISRVSSSLILLPMISDPSHVPYPFLINFLCFNVDLSSIFKITTYRDIPLILFLVNNIQNSSIFSPKTYKCCIWLLFTNSTICTIDWTKLVICNIHNFE